VFVSVRVPIISSCSNVFVASISLFPPGMDLFTPHEPNAQVSFSPSTLLLVRTSSIWHANNTNGSPFVFLVNRKPIPSLASVPQLAADLLIHSLGMRRIGTLSSRDHIPVVGGLDGSNDVPGESSGGIETAVQGENYVI
jgi:hypothetical protein